MGWISKRCFETGRSIGGRSGKHKGPLRKIVEVHHQGVGMFDRDSVTFECGHRGVSYGGVRGRCAECGNGDPKYNDIPQERTMP